VFRAILPLELKELLLHVADGTAFDCRRNLLHHAHHFWLRNAHQSRNKAAAALDNRERLAFFGDVRFQIANWPDGAAAGGSRLRSECFEARSLGVDSASVRTPACRRRAAWKAFPLISRAKPRFFPSGNFPARTTT
jgi:hypothetical protein